MEEALQAKLNQLLQKITDATFLVGNVLEAEDPGIHEIDQCHDVVAEIADTYASLQEEIPEEDREQVERTVGRRVTDIRRIASRLPQRSSGGQRAQTVKPVDSGWPEFYRRAEGAARGSRPRGESPTRAPLQAVEGHRVGGDLEAWCGPCEGLREHTVVAVVGGQAKQVICQSCGAKHGYRLTPARSKSKAEESTSGKVRKPRLGGQIDAAKTALVKELNSAEEVRPFVRRARYKAGEIIEHPQLGRGKVESVLRGSLLVRFRDGLKSVDNF